MFWLARIAVLISVTAAVVWALLLGGLLVVPLSPPPQPLTAREKISTARCFLVGGSEIGMKNECKWGASKPTLISRRKYSTILVGRVATFARQWREGQT
jgi:hypothetical protein